MEDLTIHAITYKQTPMACIGLLQSNDKGMSSYVRSLSLKHQEFYHRI